MKLDIRRVSVSYGAVQAVDDVSLTAEKGEIIALLGPSGCGKSTLLRSIAGLVKPRKGEIWIGERNVTYTPVHQRRVGLVFQNYALFSHLNVEDNIAFGLRMRGVPRAQRPALVKDLLQALRLEGLRKKNVSELSGGQQQRVALARTLVTSPDILLLDEPLSALDRQLREHARMEIRRLVKAIGTTTVIVTHDQEEALGLADQIVIMRDGKIEQKGTGLHLYLEPANVFVASFLGKANILPVNLVKNGSGFKLGIGSSGHRVDVPDSLVHRAFPDKVPTFCTMIVRHEGVRVNTPLPQSEEGAGIPGVIRDATFLGQSWELVLDIEGVLSPVVASARLAESGLESSGAQALRSVAITFAWDSVALKPAADVSGPQGQEL